MGVTLDLRLIDHKRIAVQGLRAVNKAVRHDNPEILREYLGTLPIDVNKSVVDTRRARLSKLRELNAPKVIIQNEMRLLDMANGKSYRPAALKNATFDELREALGTWCWMNHCYSLGKVWGELHWFLEPKAGPDNLPLYPEVYHKVGDSDQTVFSKALKGTVSYPKDRLGDPVIRTLGSRDPECSGYNPPNACKVILEALRGVKPAAWVRHVLFRSKLYRLQWPGMKKKEIARQVKNDLSYAAEGFPILLSTYSKAVEKGYGVSCEYSL